MSRRSWFGLLSVCAIFAASAPRDAAAQQRQNFTGTVSRVAEGSDGIIAHFRFEAGARTKWHSHERGQIILTEEGVCRTQVKGGPVMELHAGDAIFTPPGAVHWHGAAPGQSCVQYNVTRGGVMWLDEVSEKDYSAPPKR